MAVELLSASSARLEFGDIAAIGGAGELTVAFTIKTTGSFGGGRLSGQWGNSGGERAFLIERSGNEIGFVMTQNGVLGGQAYGETTSDSPMAINKLHRIVCTFVAVPKAMGIWVNGVKSSTTNWFNGNPLSIHNVTSEVFLGYEADSPGANVDGDYSEYAIWDHKVPDWVAEAYGIGATPNIYREGGILYTKATNTSHLIDEWEGNTVTNTNGTTSEHQRMFYQPNQSVTAQVAAVPVFQAVSFGARSVIVENGVGVSSSI